MRFGWLWQSAALARQGTDGLLTVLFAPSCAACRRLLDVPTAGPVCEACWSAVRPFAPPACRGCGEPLPSWRLLALDAGRCPRCRRTPRAVDAARAIGPYEGSLREIVHAFKYEARRSLAWRLARLMRAHGADVLDGADLAVPVPLHPRRRRARGFNQAADLVRHLGLPALHALRRTRNTPSQTELPAARRHGNVRDAFALARRPWARAGAIRKRLEGRRVLLVDDVATTGATLEACARVLKRAGAREVRALTAARVAGPGRLQSPRPPRPSADRRR
jgi:ComF family protein